MNTLSNSSYVATVSTENERSFFLSDSQGKKVDSTLRRLGFIPSEEFITDIRLDDIGNSLKQIGVKPRVRISRIEDHTEIQFTLKIRSAQSGSAFQNVFDHARGQISEVISPEKQKAILRSYTKDGKYEEGQEITIILPKEIIKDHEGDIIEPIRNHIHQNIPKLTQAFRAAYEESAISGSEFGIDSKMLASLQVIEVRRRSRMNYHQSLDDIYPGIAVALEPGRTQMKLDIEGGNDEIIRNFAAKIGVIPHIYDSIVEGLTKNIESNISEILQELSPYAQSQLIRRIVWSQIIRLHEEGYSGIAGKFLTEDVDGSMKKKDNFRKFDRLYPFYQEEIQKYILRKLQEPHAKIHKLQEQLSKKLFAIFVIFGEKINPTLFPMLLQLPERTLQKYKMKILSWHTKHGDSPFFKILRNGMRQAIRQDVSANNSAISDETTHGVYREHMIAMFRELYRLFEVYNDSERGLPGDIFEKMKEYILIFQKLLGEGINLGDRNIDQFLDFVSQQSKDITGVEYLIEYFREAMIYVYRGDTSEQIKRLIDQELRARRDADQEQWKGSDIITRHSELFEKIDITNITFDEWMRMTHRARISFFIHKIVSVDTEKQCLKLSDAFVEKVKKTRTAGLFKAIAQPLYKQFYSTIYDRLEDYASSLQTQYDQLGPKLAKSTSITDFVRDNMNDVYLLLAVFEQTFKDRKDQETQKKYSNVSYGVMQTLGDRMQRDHIFSKIDESKKGLYFAIRPKNRAGMTLKDALGRYDHQMQHYHIDLRNEDFQFSFGGEKHYMKDVSPLYILSSSAPENRAFLKYVAIDIVTRLLGGEHIDMIHPYADEREYPDLQALKGNDAEFGKMHEKYEEFKKTLFQYGFVAKDGSIKKNELFHLRRFLKFAYSQVKIVDTMLAQSRSEDRVILVDILDPKKVASKDKELKNILSQSEIDIPSGTKDFERTFVKNISKYAGGHEGLGDLVRGRIILDTTDRSIDMISHLIESLRQHDKICAFVVEDNTGNLMEKPKKTTGYRDITFSLQLNGGNIIEIQLVAQPIVEAKHAGYDMYHAIGDDTLMGRFQSAIRTLLTQQDRDDIQRIIQGINAHKKKGRHIFVLPRAFNDLFGEGISLEQQYTDSQFGIKLSSDMLYKIHRTLPENSELAQKLKKIESILYDLAMGELVAEEIRDMAQKDKKRSKGEKTKKKEPWLASIGQIADLLPFRGR